MDNIIILDKESHISRALPTIFSLIEKHEKYLVSLIGDIPSENLSKKHINFKIINNNRNPEISLESEAFIWLEKLSKLRFNSGSTFKESMNYYGGSFWNFIVASLYIGRFYYPLKDVIMYAHLVSEIIDEEKPRKIFFIEDGLLLSDIILSIKSDKIELIRIANPYNKISKYNASKLKRELKRYILPPLFFLHMLIRKGYWYILPFNKESKKGSVLLASGDQLRYITNLFSKREILGDPYYENIIECLCEKHIDTTFVGFFVHESLLGLGVITKRFLTKDERIFYRPFEAFISRECINNIIKSYKHLAKNCYNELKALECVDDLKYRHCSLYEIVEDSLSFYASKYLLFVVLPLFETSLSMIRKERPSIIVVPESSIEARCISFAARILDTPTIGLQHGDLSPYNADYCTNDADMFPETTILSGEYYKKMIFSNSRISQDRLSVLGMPRYDILSNPNNIYDGLKIKNEHKIDLTSKIIIWLPAFRTLNNQGNIRILKLLMRSIRNIEKSFLIIKPHPGDDDNYIRFIKYYIVKNKLKAFVVPKMANIYKLLFISDLIITYVSTTAMEAIAMNKPVIILDLGKNSRPSIYVEEGVAVGVYKDEDLAPAIDLLLNDDSKLELKRKSFILKYLYLNDGNATERTVDTILDRKIQ
jgi:hypothetical protein